MFSNDVLSKAFDGGLDVAGYSATYCTDCMGPGERVDYWDFQGVDWNDPEWALTAPAYWGSNGTGCHQGTWLGCHTASAKAVIVLPVPGTDTYTVDFTAYGYGDFGDESEVNVDGGESAEGPWTPVMTFWRPNFPDSDCGVKEEQKTSVALAGYTHIRYKLSGIGVASPALWLNFKAEWTIPT